MVKRLITLQLALIGVLWSCQNEPEVALKRLTQRPDADAGTSVSQPPMQQSEPSANPPSNVSDTAGVENDTPAPPQGPSATPAPANNNPEEGEAMLPPMPMPMPTSHPRVVVLGIDGMGSENVWRTQKSGIRPPSVPNLNRIRDEGVASLNAKVDDYNFSGPNWMGIITGSSSQLHGVLTNDCERGKMMPTIYDVLRAQRPSAVIGIVHEWEMIACHVDKSKVQNIVKTGDANATADAVIKLWQTASPDFIFVQFDEVDHMGHAHGGTSNEYVAAVEKVDAAIGRIYTALVESPTGGSTYIIVVADHGMGEGGNHAPSSAPVPLFIRGPGLPKADLKESVYNRHVAPFAAYLLGIKPAPEWETTSAPLEKYRLK